jgi:hypothetical protein
MSGLDRMVDQALLGYLAAPIAGPYVTFDEVATLASSSSSSRPSAATDERRRKGCSGVAARTGFVGVANRAEHAIGDRPQMCDWRRTALP